MNEAPGVEERQRQRKVGSMQPPMETSGALLMLRHTVRSHERALPVSDERAADRPSAVCVSGGGGGGLFANCCGEESSPFCAAGESEMERREREGTALRCCSVVCPRPSSCPVSRHPLLDMAPTRIPSWLMHPAPRCRRSLRPGEQQAVRIVCISGFAGITWHRPPKTAFFHP
jgi:hypothetical protein